MSEQNNIEATASSQDSRNTVGSQFFKKRKGCPLCITSAPAIDYKNPDLLGKFISEGGRMLPSRITNVCSTHQRKLKKAIRHSRILALLPFVFSGK